MVPIALYYLGSTPAAPVDSPSFTRPQSMSQPPSQPRSSSGVTTHRASMPPPSRAKSISPPATSAFVNQPMASPETQSRAARFEPTLEESVEDDAEDVQLERTGHDNQRKSRSGIMNKDFRFPPNANSDTPIKKAHPPPPLAPESLVTGTDTRKPNVITPSSVEVPPPPPVEKGNTGSHTVDEGEEEVGPTVEISLN